MMLDKELVRLIKLVMELKRRRIFNSMVITNTGVQVGYWDAGLRQCIISDQHGAWMHLHALEENDRQEIEYVGQRLGRRRA